MTQPRHGAIAPVDPWRVDAGDFPVYASLRDQLRFVLNYAVLAPSGHNTQPWLFRLGDGVVDVLADRRRRLPVVDPNDRELTMSCAAAAETLMQAARQFGLAPRLEPLPEGEDADVIARIEVKPDKTIPRSLDVLEAILNRRTTRKAFDADALPSALRIARAEAARAHRITLAFAGDAATHGRIADLVAEADRRQFDDPAFRRELARWIRPRSAPGRDGMSGAAFGMPDSLSGFGAFMIRSFDIGGLAASGDARLIRDGSPVFVALASANDAPSDWVSTGRALAEMLIALSGAGWTASYLNQPIELADLRPKLAEALGIDLVPQLLLRVGRAERPAPSVRRPVVDVLVP